MDVLEELLALAASPDVLEQRELMHRMMREESRARLLQTARARARAAGTPTPPKPRLVAGGAAYEPPLLPAEAPTSTARVSVAVCAFGEGGERVLLDDTPTEALRVQKRDAEQRANGH